MVTYISCPCPEQQVAELITTQCLPLVLSSKVSFCKKWKMPSTEECSVLCICWLSWKLIYLSMIPLPLGAMPF